ncbi:hypothetical protein [Massilia niastensis]|uniref:hypothetical protein n=1 Tax=Massilia niastensis TaxID=544911 RepID=UPI0003A2ED23|nr:hypothetical protein [Massilia niastensis]
MNIHKHMEAIFVVALAAIGAGTVALDSVPEARATSSAPVARDIATSGGAMAVVIVRAPRLARQP